MGINLWLTTPVDLSDGLNRPLGGAEISAVQLAKQLSRNNCLVTIYGNTRNRYEMDGVNVRPYFDSHYERLWILIVVRAHPLLTFRGDRWMPRPFKVFNWSGDAYDQRNNLVFEDARAAELLDAFICKSRWQADEIEKRFPLLRGKCVVIRNGVDAALFPKTDERDDNLFIHASTYYRGSWNFLTLWPKIKKHLPKARLRMYINTSLYGVADASANELFTKLAALPDVELRQPVVQSELIKELSNARLLLYPNDKYMESSCGVAQQSICAGTPVITSHRAGLPETVGDCGFCIKGDPKSEGYQNEFVDKTLMLCKDERLYTEMSQRGKDRLLRESWENVVNDWRRLL